MPCTVYAADDKTARGHHLQHHHTGRANTNGNTNGIAGVRHHHNMLSSRPQPHHVHQHTSAASESIYSVHKRAGKELNPPERNERVLGVEAPSVDSRPLTNAQRLARGLPINPPAVKKGSSSSSLFVRCLTMPKLLFMPAKVLYPSTSFPSLHPSPAHSSLESHSSAIFSALEVPFRAGSPLTSIASANIVSILLVLVQLSFSSVIHQLE